VESFGARLKRERLQRKISLDDIAVATKIGTRFLTALEEDQFDQLPGGVFNKGFVRAYAHHLGLDENQTVADFVAASAPVLPVVETLDPPVLEAIATRTPDTIRQRRRDKDDGLPWGIFALLLLVGAFVFALWGFHSRDHSTNVRAKVLSPAGADVATGADPSPASETAILPPTSPREAPAPKSPTAPEAQNTASETASATPEPATAEPAAIEPAGADTTPGRFLVLVKARQDAWVDITADGKQAVQDTLTPSAGKAVEARSQVVIRTGNAGALDISFNGKKLGSQGSLNQIKTLTFDSNGPKQ
jgi:cytoskeleton protein RodZ